MPRKATVLAEALFTFLAIDFSHSKVRYFHDIFAIRSRTIPFVWSSNYFDSLNELLVSLKVTLRGVFLKLFFSKLFLAIVIWATRNLCIEIVFHEVFNMVQYALSTEFMSTIKQPNSILSYYISVTNWASLYIRISTAPCNALEGLMNNLCLRERFLIFVGCAWFDIIKICKSSIYNVFLILLMSSAGRLHQMRLWNWLNYLIIIETWAFILLVLFCILWLTVSLNIAVIL